MARNDPEHPEIARAAQDVEGAPKTEPQGPKHYGRGGAANVIDDEATTTQHKTDDHNNNNNNNNAAAAKGLIGKGKDLLNKLGKK